MRDFHKKEKTIAYTTNHATFPNDFKKVARKKELSRDYGK